MLIKLRLQIIARAHRIAALDGRPGCRFPAASGDYLKAGFAADEGLIRFRCIYGLRTQPTDSQPANRFSCNGPFPVGP